MPKYAPIALAPLLLVSAMVACSDVQSSDTPMTSPTLSAAHSVASIDDKTNGKVDICHRTGGATTFILISIAPAAVNAHLAHGDGRIGEPVPGQPGMRFGSDCQPEVIPFHLTITTQTRGFVRDANRDGVGDQVFLPPPPLIQVFNTPDNEDRGILKFGLPALTQPVGHAELQLPVNSGPGGQCPCTISVYVLSGAGPVMLSDFAAGTFVASQTFLQNVPPPTQITFDVTAALNSVISAHATTVGINLRHSRFGAVVFDAFDPNVPQAGPTPVLDVRSP